MLWKRLSNSFSMMTPRSHVWSEKSLPSSVTVSRHSLSAKPVRESMMPFSFVAHLTKSYVMQLSNHSSSQGMEKQLFVVVGRQTSFQRSAPFAIVHICRADWHDVVSPLVPDDDAATEAHELVHVSLHLPRNILIELASV